MEPRVRESEATGERSYSYVKTNVRFFVLDTDMLDATQLAWIETALKNSSDQPHARCAGGRPRRSGAAVRQVRRQLCARERRNVEGQVRTWEELGKIACPPA